MNRIGGILLAKANKLSDSRTHEAFLETPGHLLRRCHQIAVAIFLDECQEFDLTPLQYVTLSALAVQAPMDKATIGGAVALDRTTVSVVVRNLEARGLVTTRPSDRDRRSRLVRITAKGLHLVSSMQTDVANAQERTIAPLTPKERAELLRLLGKIAEENNLLSRAPHRAPRVVGVARAMRGQA
ncbi:MAG TPA: MarR family winged helix-turn-helix transcriptional regulator [Acetobacteraceae bacterium]|nr:MarR family winged helix-turn-helix transcriptional regulator [Acetobacteraceae bacterium]